MIDIALDPATDDLVFDVYDLRLVDGLEAFAQDLRIGLDFQLGEWDLDVTEGLPYRDYPDENVVGRIMVRNPNLAEISAYFRFAIMKTPGAIKMQSFELTFDNASGALVLNFEVLSAFGALTGASIADNVLSLTTALQLQPLGGF